MRIGVPKETDPNESRVAMIPETAKRLIKMGVEVWVETGAGEKSFFTDKEFEEAGAKVVSGDEIWKKSGFVVKIGLLSDSELEKLPEGSAYLGFLNPLAEPERVAKLASRRITAISMEMVPRTSRAQSMDALSSQASIAGYKAALIAAYHLPKYFPMLTTAAGTIRPATVLVLGAGVAGLQAIATAKRLGAQVEAYDVRPVVKEQVQSLGAKFIEVEFEGETATSGGYAKELSEEDKKKAAEMLTKHVHLADAIITTAQVPGKKAPLLITEEMLSGVKRGAVIVDMASAQGGNVAHSKPGEIVARDGYQIVGPVNLSSQMPIHASQLYSRNVMSFLEILIKDNSFVFDFGDDIISGACVSHEGVVCNEGIKTLLGG